MVSYSLQRHHEAYEDFARRIAEARADAPDHLPSLLGVEPAMRPLDRPAGETEIRLALGTIETIPQSRTHFAHAGSPAAMGEGGYPARDWHWKLVNLDGAFVGRNNCYIIDEQIFVEDFRGISHTWRDYGHPADITQFTDIFAYDPASGSAMIDTKDAIVIGEDAPVFVFSGDLSSLNFAHFVFDSLFQLRAYDLACELAGMKLKPVFMRSCGDRGFRYPIMEFLLRPLLDWHGPFVFLNGRSARIAGGYTSTLHLSTGYYGVSFDALRHLRQRLAEIFCGPRFSSDTSPVWVSRKDGLSGRILENEAQAEACAIAHGYRSVVVSKLAPKDIIATFRNAAALAGVHGAGMMNFIFANECGPYVECLFKEWTWDCIAICASAAGHSVSRIEALDGYDAPTPGRVNLDALDCILRGHTSRSTSINRATHA